MLPVRDELVPLGMRQALDHHIKELHETAEPARI
jgi:hypothetical protein